MQQIYGNYNSEAKRSVWKPKQEDLSKFRYYDNIKSLQSRFALVLTGTPLENRLDDLYSVVEFVDARRLGPAYRFIHHHRVAAETGVHLQVIPPQEEARLSVTGCLNLLDYSYAAALVVDVGGGSTELSWVDLTSATPGQMPPLRAWLSVPIGVVTLAERFPEGETPADGWFREMVEMMKAEIAAFHRADALKPIFEADRAHLVGTSGAITSLAGMHLNLPRYDRNRVDGIWMTRKQCEHATDRLLAVSAAERAAQPCIGADRADLVLAGAAILQAVQELWPCNHVRVADRGLREGILLSLMSDRRPRKRRRRRGGNSAAATTS